jgi:hypothetical protein
LSTTTVTLAQVILEGTDAAKPSPSTAGRLYFATDTSTVYYDSATAWTIALAPASSSGTPVCLPNAQTGTNSGWQNSSIIAKIAGAGLWGSPSRWVVRMGFTAGAAVIGGMAVLRTAAGSSTVIDSTAVTIGGNAAPTLTGPGTVTTDAIDLALDTAYDYYFAVFLANDAANASVSVASNGANNLPAGYVTGNALTDTAIPSLGYGNAPYLIVGAFTA